MAGPISFSQDGASGAIDTSDAPAATSGAPSAGMLGIGGEYEAGGSFVPLGNQFPSPSRVPNPGFAPMPGAGSAPKVQQLPSSGGGGSGGPGFAPMPNNLPTPALPSPISSSPSSNRTPNALGFADGGAIPDGEDDSNGSPEQDHISRALDTVDRVLAFGRQQYGLGGGSNEGVDTTSDNPVSQQIGGRPQDQTMRKSDNIEDRRGDTSPPTKGGSTKADALMDWGTNMVNQSRDEANPMSQDAGIGSIPRPKWTPNLSAPTGVGNQQAIDTSDQEQQ